MEALCEIGTLFISVILMIAFVSGLLTFMGVILEFIILSMEALCMFVSGVFYHFPKWCWKKAREM